MSAKKKIGATISAQCESCGNFFLRVNSKNRPDSKPSTPNAKTSTPSTKTATPNSLSADTPSCSHGDVWETDEGDAPSAVQFVAPRVGMRALAHVVEKRDSLLPSELFGWERRNSVLLNPETITQLGVLPRSAIIVEFPPTPSLTDDSDHKTYRRGIFIVWPCSEIPQMRINLPAELSPSTKFIHVFVARPRRISSVVLSLSDEDTAGISDEFVGNLANDGTHFIYYLKSYLSNAYLNHFIPVAINFYTKKLLFNVKETKLAYESNEQSLGALNLSDQRSFNTEAFMVTTETSIEVAWNLASAVDEDEDVR